MDNLLKYLIATILVTISGVLINRSVRFLIDVMREEISETLIANQELKQTWENIPVFASFMLLFIFILMLRFSVGIAALVGSGGIPFQFFLAYIVYIIIISVFEGGGNALLKHVILRIVLAANRYAPSATTCSSTTAPSASSYNASAVAIGLCTRPFRITLRRWSWIESRKDEL